MCSMAAAAGRQTRVVAGPEARGKRPEREEQGEDK
jgi:hypothetical protein